MTRALVICGDKWHPAETVRRGLAPLASAGFAFEFLEDGAKWLPEMFEHFPLVVLAKANMISATDEDPWLTDETQFAFQDFLSRGGGLVIVHAGTSRYEKISTMLALTGGAFVSHPPECAVTMEPKTGHKLTRGVGIFSARDEHYFMALEDASADVFLHSRSEHGVQPAGWTRAEGAGRVCVLTPGHNLEVWLQPGFQKLLTNALRWAAKLGSPLLPVERTFVEAPSTNLQAPENLQASMTKLDFWKPRCLARRLADCFGHQPWLRRGLELAAWMFSGAWCLELGTWQGITHTANREEPKTKK